MARTRGAVLYVRSRRLRSVLVLLVAVHVIGYGIGTAELQLREDGSSTIPWAILLPLLSACLLAASIRSPLGDLDRLATRAMWCWRAGHLAIGLGVCLLGAILLTVDLDGATTTASAVRNLLGLLGLALLGGRLIEGRLGWLLPCIAVFAAATVGDPDSSLPPWDWPIRYDDDQGALVVGLVLLAAGCLVGVLGGTKESPAEIE